MSSYLKFQVQFHTQLNQTIRIVGNIKELGEWDPIKGLQLFTNAQLYPDWTHDTFIEIPRGTVLEFKCVKYEGERLVKWENFQIDMNRKYKTQYYKAMLFMKEDNIQVIERPFQKYTGNHDYDIIDTTNAKKIQDKFIVFDPLRKADGLSSSSDNSSLDFFRRQSKISDDFNVIDNQMDQQKYENGMAVIDARKMRQKKEFTDDEDDFNSDDIQNNHDNFEDVHLEKIIDTQPKQGEVHQEEHTRKLRGAGLGIKFNQSSLNQIQNNLPMNLENIFLLFNRVKKESNCLKEKYPTIRKIVDLKDINLINQNQLHQVQNQNSQQSNGNDSDSTFKNIKNMRNVKSMPYINTQLQDKAEKTMIVVSYRLPYFVKNKKKKSARMSTDMQISQMYDFTENFDPLIDSIYQSISNVKLNLIWVGICNIYVESESDQEDLREYMLKKYRCYPLFYKEETNQMFSRQFCSKFLYPQTENIMFYEEEKCWKVYKDINKDVANVLKKFTNESISIFAIVIYDFHFFLVPSYFQKQKTHSPGHLQQFDFSDKITIAFFMNRKFPQLQILEMLPQSDIFMHSLFFCDIMSFSTYESCESFLSLSQKMGCAVLHKAGGKIMLQCNGREILIRIEHPGINLKKLQITKDLIQKQVEEMTLILQDQNKHQLIGIDSISRNSGLEYKFRAFEKFLNKEKQNQSKQEYKLKQIVYFSTDSEFQTSQDQQDYLNEVKSLARSINQSQSFYDSAIEIIEGDSLSFEDYYQYLSISEVFLSTVLQETRHFHYMEYLFLKKDGQLILSNCLNQISQFSAVNIINPQDQPKIVSTLSKIFQNLAKNKKTFKEQIKPEQQQVQSQIYINQPSISLKKDKESFATSQQLIYLQDGLKMQEDRKKLAADYSNSDGNNVNNQSSQIIQDKIRINITEKNNTSEQAQREFDYNYLIKFCSSQNWINHFISDIVKRQSVQKNTCIFISTEEKTVALDKQNNNVHKEIISKIYERSSQQYIEINLQNLIYRCKNAKNAVFIFGFSSVFFDHPSNLLSEPKPNPLLFKQVEELSKQPNVQIYIISGKSPELLQKYFGHIKNIILIAYNGFKIQQTGSDLDFFQLTSKYEHTLWKMQVQTKMENFVQKTAGSYIVDSELQTSWHFENVEKEFADAQKNELIKQLVQIVESMPGNEIFEGYDFVQVRPQCLNKGVMTKIAIQNSCLLKNKKIDFLVIVGGRKTTDEEMLKSARDTIYDDNISYFESNSPAILGSISSQLGALYCNHQFENNQELAVLLEMMNGNKQLLKTDQFANINHNQTQANPQKFAHINNHHNGNSPPPLVRMHTMCENNIEILNEKLKVQNLCEEDNEQNNLQQYFDSDSKQSPLFIDNNYFLNQNQIFQKRRIKAQDIKIPFISQSILNKQIV
ncbi:trehalose-6-phosphate synthase (macronuclear) [Tetrahymena thermophila SB210]|uniref:Trehalose-6-phosphate synthase n=1 Tax=Tetrahymena thermophila (strain SB210) TaxID=312017 RepID=Q22TC2_TETTS|nr:trehalose-6-phosphate synthase [Tetrahymena thermophila SB210]EAR88516.2 trehalose-6-phosphate synthase [Tetrahymena thermophila SB210]|eukprot:XP_001008761.2 trehalose-6-phosphate synthase [Tetrahymena thermophila SB210]